VQEDDSIKERLEQEQKLLEENDQKYNNEIAEYCKRRSEEFKKSIKPRIALMDLPADLPKA